MNTTKRVGALICAGALALSLAACGGGGGSSAGGQTPAEILAAADAKVNEATSMDATMTMEMAINVNSGEQAMELPMTMTGNLVCFTDPMKAKVDMDVTIDMSGLMGLEAGDPSATQTQNVQMYIEQNEDGTATTYTNDGTGWTSETSDDLGDLMQYNPQDSMSLYLDSGSAFVAGAEEDLNGVKATKYTGVITGAALEKVINASGVLDNLDGLTGSFDTEGADLAALYQDMGDMPVSIWIDAAGYPVRYEMDMTEMMNAMVAKLTEQLAEDLAGATIDLAYVKVSMDISNYNAATEFEIPAEAIA
jgi:hypothetical protein